MEWLIKHWWILVLVFLVGVIINVIKDLNRVDHKNSSTTNPICRRTVILTIKWDDDDDDWPKHDQSKKP